MVFGAPQLNQPQWPPQLFNLTSDPWEHHNLASVLSHEVERMRALLALEIDMDVADTEAKAFDKYMFEKYWYEAQGGASGCAAAMAKAYPGFNASTDAPKVAQWLGKPCSNA